MNDEEFDKWWRDFRKECEQLGGDHMRLDVLARRILQTCLGDQSDDWSISDICDE